MVFGHRKCSGGYRVLIGSLEGVQGTPDKRYGPNGPRGETQQPAGAAAPPYGLSQRTKERGEERRKGRDSAPPFLPSSLQKKDISVTFWTERKKIMSYL